MGSRNVTVVISYVLMMIMLVGFASSDLAQDRTECANQLLSLAPCLPYVGGQGKAPALDCCTGLKQVLQKSMKCLCILIKDRNDPKLGLKVNATLAAMLPSSCHAPVNVTECIDLLHLPPSSQDAKVFIGYANITKGSISAPVSSGNSTSSGAGAAGEKSDGGRAMRWLVMEMICGFFLCAFNFVYFGI